MVRSRAGWCSAPANDLAWRCDARMVVVSNTDAGDQSSKAAVKLQAIAKSGADVEFWIDLEHPLAEAALKAVAYRPRLHAVRGHAPTDGHPAQAAPLASATWWATWWPGPACRCWSSGRGRHRSGPGHDRAGGGARLHAQRRRGCWPSRVEWCKALKLRLIVTAVAGAGHQLHPVGPPAVPRPAGRWARRRPAASATELLQGDDEADGGCGASC